MRLDFRHNRGADNGPLSETRDAAGLFRSLDSEANDDGQLSRGMDAGERGADVALGIALGAGDAGDGGVIEIAGGAFEHGLEARIAGGGREEAHNVDAMAGGLDAEMAMAIATTPATSGVPERTSRSCPPPCNNGTQTVSRRSSSAPTPVGPPNLWAVTLMAESPAAAKSTGMWPTA